MHTLLLTLHVVAAVFLIGPLGAALNNAGGALRRADVARLTAVARTVRIYGWASLVVFVLGMGLVGRSDHAGFGDGWVIASLVLFVLATALVLGLLEPLLRRAVAASTAGEPTVSFTGRAAALGGAASLFYVAITVLMVAQPGT